MCCSWTNSLCAGIQVWRRQSTAGTSWSVHGRLGKIAERWHCQCRFAVWGRCTEKPAACWGNSDSGELMAECAVVQHSSTDAFQSVVNSYYPWHVLKKLIQNLHNSACQTYSSDNSAANTSGFSNNRAFRWVVLLNSIGGSTYLRQT